MVGSRITASSPEVQVQLLELARATSPFPCVALFTRGDCKIAGAMIRSVTRSRSCELRTRMQSDLLVRVHATFASPRFSPQCWRLHPSPPTHASSASFRVSMVVLACRRLRQSPAAYLVPRPSPFLLGSLVCARTA